VSLSGEHDQPEPWNVRLPGETTVRPEGARTVKADPSVGNHG
jgi:hypothetical protein